MTYNQLDDDAGKQTQCHRRRHAVQFKMRMNLLICFLSFVLCHGPGCVVYAQQKEDTRKSSALTKPMTLKPIELDFRNFDSHVLDGNVWLIEFYTPGCIHCISFAESYSNIAATFHSSPNEKIRVGKVNVAKQKALSTRFGIHSYPCFFLIDGWSVYEYDQPRSVPNLMDFARGGYKKEEPLPFLFSPMGPVGLLQGGMVMVGSKLLDVMESIQNRYSGTSPIIIALALCGFAVVGGFVSIVLLTIFISSKDKYD